MSIRKAKSRLKNSMKNMTVDLSVHRSRIVVKMNQPVRKKPTADSPILGSMAATASVAYGPPLPRMFQLGVSRIP